MDAEEVLSRINQAALEEASELDLAGLGLRSLPPQVWNVTNLTSLHLEYNELSSLPSEIGNLTSLTNLYLGHNQLTELPPEIGNLTSLRDLDLSNNQLTELPPQIVDIVGLEWLSVRNNRLTAIPQSMVKLEKLSQGRSSIRVVGQFVSDGRVVCNLGPPSSLTPKGLDLSHNLLTILPPEINQLREEWGIDLSGNPLMS